MSYPANYRYTDSHEWVSVDGNVATCGITHHAQDALGDVVFVDLPAVGTTFAANITSDETGIGNWTYEQFERALHGAVFTATAMQGDEAAVHAFGLATPPPDRPAENTIPTKPCRGIRPTCTDHPPSRPEEGPRTPQQDRVPRGLAEQHEQGRWNEGGPKKAECDGDRIADNRKPTPQGHPSAAPLHQGLPTLGLDHIEPQPTRQPTRGQPTPKAIVDQTAEGIARGGHHQQ